EKLLSSLVLHRQAPRESDRDFVAHWVRYFQDRWLILNLDARLKKEDLEQKVSPTPYRRPSYLMWSHLPPAQRLKDQSVLRRDARHHILLVSDWMAAMGRGGDRVVVGLSDRAPLHDLASELDRIAGHCVTVTH